MKIPPKLRCVTLANSAVPPQTSNPGWQGGNSSPPGIAERSKESVRSDTGHVDAWVGLDVLLVATVKESSSQRDA